MTSDVELRRALMQACGSASVAVSIIDNGGADAHVLLAKVRDALMRGFNGAPIIRRQTCPAGVHRDWWADGDTLDCPWCRIADLEGASAPADAGAA